MCLLQPDKLFSHITQVDISRDILDYSIQAVLIDIDNTIRPRGQKDIPRDVLTWIRKVQTAGLTVCFLSNNFHQNVYELSSSINVSVVAKALKPLPIGYLRASLKLHLPLKYMLMIGDQLFTDILGAHLVGMRAYLVAPLVENDLKHTQMLRSLEARILKEPRPEATPVGVLKSDLIE